MLVTYFDEVKIDPKHQPNYWLGGIVASAETIWNLERQVADLSQEVFGTPDLTRETEFHARAIFHRKDNFKNHKNVPDRLSILKRLLTVLDKSDVGKIYVRIDPARMVASDPERKAFLFFVERVELYLRSRSNPGILIGDRENDSVSSLFAETLSRYRSSGTPYHFGTELTHLIDTVHYTSSHHSRMLQLADIYVWTQQFAACKDNTAYPRSDLAEFVRNSTSILIPNRYKVWPTEQSWIQA